MPSNADLEKEPDASPEIVCLDSPVQTTEQPECRKSPESSTLSRQLGNTPNSRRISAKQPGPTKALPIQQQTQILNQQQLKTLAHNGSVIPKNIISPNSQKDSFLYLVTKSATGVNYIKTVKLNQSSEQNQNSVPVSSSIQTSPPKLK